MASTPDTVQSKAEDHGHPLHRRAAGGPREKLFEGEDDEGEPHVNAAITPLTTSILEANMKKNVRSFPDSMHT